MRTLLGLSMACMTMLVLTATADAGDIRFQRFGRNITRFNSDQFGSGTIYNYGSTGRIRFDDDGGSFNRFGSDSYRSSRRYDSGYGLGSGGLGYGAGPCWGAPAFQTQYGANAPLYVPLQRPVNRPAWAR